MKTTWRAENTTFEKSADLPAGTSPSHRPSPQGLWTWQEGAPASLLLTTSRRPLSGQCARQTLNHSLPAPLLVSLATSTCPQRHLQSLPPQPSLPLVTSTFHHGTPLPDPSNPNPGDGLLSLIPRIPPGTVGMKRPPFPLQKCKTPRGPIRSKVLGFSHEIWEDKAPDFHCGQGWAARGQAAGAWLHFPWDSERTDPNLKGRQATEQTYTVP